MLNANLGDESILKQLNILIISHFRLLGFKGSNKTEFFPNVAFRRLLDSIDVGVFDRESSRERLRARENEREDLGAKDSVP